MTRGRQTTACKESFAYNFDCKTFRHEETMGVCHTDPSLATDDAENSVIIVSTSKRYDSGKM